LVLNQSASVAEERKAMEQHNNCAQYVI